MKIKSMFDVSHTHRSPRPSIRLIGQVICKDVKCPRQEPKVETSLLSDNDLGIWKSWEIPAVGKYIPVEGGVE